MLSLLVAAGALAADADTVAKGATTEGQPATSGASAPPRQRPAQPDASRRPPTAQGTQASGEAGGTRPSPGLVDHRPFDQLLRQFVKNGRVDYKGFKSREAQLDRYLTSLAPVKLDKASRAEKLALYVNAYNACTIKLILENLGKITSIKEIDDPWGTRRWRIAGEVLSLDDMEHKKLRAELKEPRIHFAIVCASISCPPLAERAYTPKAIEAQLDAAARRFIRSRDRVRTEVDSGFFSTSYILYLSKIFDWYEEDFTAGGKQSVVDFVLRYADPETAKFIREHRDGLKIKYLPYDWKLNGA